MAIQFPNPSRTYDARHRCVRFWGHDDSREVTFQIDENALARISHPTQNTEEALLLAFDTNRELILRAATKAYSPRGSGFYTLAASSF